MNLVTIDTTTGNMPLYIGPNNATSVIIGNSQSNVNIQGNVSIQNVSIINMSFSTITSGTTTIRSAGINTSNASFNNVSTVSHITNHLRFNYTNLATLQTNGYWIQTGTCMINTIPIGESNRSVSFSLFTPELISYTGVHYAQIHNESSSPGITFSLSAIANPLVVYTYNPYGISKTNITFRIIMYCW